MKEYPPFDSLKSCPKCGMEFYQPDVLRVPATEARNPPWLQVGIKPETVPDTRFLEARAWGNVPEMHVTDRMKRFCPKCRYFWVEACPVIVQGDTHE